MQPNTVTPRNVRSSSIFVDESGSRNSPKGIYVVGFVKTSKHSELVRNIRSLRGKYADMNTPAKEIKFSKITKNSRHFYFDLVELLADEKVKIGASIYHSVGGFPDHEETWLIQAKMVARLVSANIRKGEHVNVFMDLVSTPVESPLGCVVEGMITKRLKDRPNFVTAYELDSRASDLIQVADIVAGAIAYQRRYGENQRSPKGEVSSRLCRAFKLSSFDDLQTGRVNILTMKTPQR